MIRRTAISGIFVLVALAVASCSDNSTSDRETTPPSVEIQTPYDGSTREGIIDIVADATDDTGIEKVVFYVNGAKAGEDTTDPYELDWDSTPIANNASVAVYAVAYDVEGNKTASPTVTFTKGESKSPTVSITGPASGYSVMQGYLTVLSGTAADPEDGAVSNFIWTSNLQGKLGEGATINYRGFVIGAHTITLTATDSDGNKSTDTVNITVTDNDKDYAYIQEGTYIVGPPLFAKRTVTFSRPLLVSKTELSIKEFRANFDSTKAEKPAGSGKSYYGYRMTTASGNLYIADLLLNVNKWGDYPVCFVTIHEMMAYTEALNVKQGLNSAYTFIAKSGEPVALKSGVPTYSKAVKAEITANSNGWRLPTELEWEVAASGGDAGKRFPWGNELVAGRCNSMADVNPVNMAPLVFGRGITPVKSYAEFRNPFGLYNIAGNVAEMCSDVFLGGLPQGIDYVGTADVFADVVYVVKGGTWYDSGDGMQIQMRKHFIPYSYSTQGRLVFNSGYGARLVRNLEKGEAPW